MGQGTEDLKALAKQLVDLLEDEGGVGTRIWAHCVYVQCDRIAEYAPSFKRVCETPSSPFAGPSKRSD